MQLLIYTAKTSSRLEYIVSTLMNGLGIEDCRLTTDSTFFSQLDGIKINYSSKPLSATELWQSPVNLLFETGIRQQEIKCFGWKGNKAFFKSEGDFGFDI